MIKLSASSIGTYEKCPKKYYYQYIGKPNIKIPDWPHLEFGTVAHRVLELFHGHLMKTFVYPDQWKEVMRESFKQALIESQDRKKVDLIRDNLADLRKIMQDYLNIMRINGLPAVIHNELEFKFKIKDFTIRGFIDRVDKYDNGVYQVIDYKTSKNGNYLTDFQLAIYALALKEIYQDISEISGSYILLKQNCSLKSWNFTPADLEKTCQQVIRLGTDINTETIWEKRPSALCNWCDFKSICQDSWVTDDGD